MLNLIKSTTKLVDSIGGVKGDSVVGLGFYVDEKSDTFTGLSLKLSSGRVLDVFLIETPKGEHGIEWEVLPQGA